MVRKDFPRKPAAWLATGKVMTQCSDNDKVVKVEVLLAVEQNVRY